MVQPVSLYPERATGAMVRVDTSSAYDGFGSAATFPVQAAYDPTEPVGFGGQFGYYKDGATGLYLLTHRYYDAGAGRFVNRDPIGYKGGINLYGFAGNNPVNESDPSGFAPGDREGYIDTEKVRFSQNGYNENMSGPSRTVTGLVRDLRSGKALTSNMDPIRLVRYQGSIYTIDNRRLLACHQAGKEAPYRWARPDEMRSFEKHNTTKNGGVFIEPNEDFEAGTDVISRFNATAGKIGEGLNALGGLLFMEKEWGEMGWIMSNRTPADYKRYRRFLYITNPSKYRTMPSEVMYDIMYGETHG